MYLIQVENELFIAIIAGTLIFLILSGFAISHLLLLKKRRHQHIHELQQIKAAYQQELLITQLEIQEQTLKNIGQEIHDNIGQTLSLAKLNLNTMKVEGSDVVAGKINNVRELVSKAIHDLRDLSRTLNTDNIAKSGLLKAAEQEMCMLEKTGAIKTSLEVSGTPLPLDPQKELILFRIIQEGMQNVIKHAQATTVKLLLCYQDDGLQLALSDDGCGFETSELREGSGLQNMQSRCKLIGAEFKLTSAKEGGTELMVSLKANNQ